MDFERLRLDERLSSLSEFDSLSDSDSDSDSDSESESDVDSRSRRLDEARDLFLDGPGHVCYQIQTKSK